MIPLRALLWPGLGMLLLVVYATAAVLPPLALSPPGLAAAAPTVNSLAPQGWSFFTRSPREGDLAAYRRSDEGNLESATLMPSNRWENAFGVSRRGRSEGVEMALLRADVRGEAWTECDSLPVEECLELAGQEAPNVTVVSRTPSPRLCGEIFLVHQTVVPWAYRHSLDHRLVAEAAVQIDVECTR